MNDNYTNTETTNKGWDTYTYNNCEILYKVYQKTEDLPDVGNYKLTDLKGYLIRNNITNIRVIDIDSVYVEEELRGKGFGSECLKRFCSDNNHYLLILAAGFHARDAEKLDDIELKNYPHESLMKKLNTFYTNNGFIDVNNILGYYSGMCTMIYYNKYYQELATTLGLVNE